MVIASLSSFDERNLMIGQRIRILRKQLKMNQSEFGKHFGMSCKAISRIESGVDHLNPRMLRIICIQYDVNPVWLESGEGEMFVSQRGEAT